MDHGCFLSLSFSFMCMLYVFLCIFYSFCISFLFRLAFLLSSFFPSSLPFFLLLSLFLFLCILLFFLILYKLPHLFFFHASFYISFFLSLGTLHLNFFPIDSFSSICKWLESRENRKVNGHLVIIMTNTKLEQDNIYIYIYIAQLAGAVACTSCISAEG